MMCRPLSSHEPLSHDNLVAMAKLQAEGQPFESKTVLGWEVNTRSLQCHLTNDK